MAEIVEITPYDQSVVTPNPMIASLNYTNQDFWSLKSRLVDFINERFGPNGTVIPNTFNDLIEGDLAVMLVETWAFLADMLSFKMDQIANEVFVDTVTEIDNAFRLSKLVGFYPQPPIAARSLWIATINNPLLTSISIEAPLVVDVVSEDRPIKIELFQADADNNPLLDDPIVIPAGATSNKSIIGLEGQTRIETFVGTGAVSQTFQLTFSPVIYDSVRIYVDGVMWQQVDYFTDSQPRREYRLEFDSSYNAYIIFGNNRAGLIPSVGASLKATYRIGGGTVGNIVTGYVTTQTQTAVPGLGYSVPVSLRNYTKGEFGYNGDDVNAIRSKLPLWVRTQDRAVSGEDYKILTDQFTTPYHGSIGKSTAVLRNHGCAGNIVDIYVLARDRVDGLQIASNELKVDLIEMLNTKKMLTDYICIRDGTIINVDSQIDVTLDKFYKKFEPEFRAQIEQKVTTFFSLANWEYGQTLKNTDLIKQLASIKEIMTFDIHFVTSDTSNSGESINARFFEIVRPDVTTISFIYE